MSQILDYMPIIKLVHKEIDRRSKRKDWDKDEEIIELLAKYHKYIYTQIYTVLVPIGTDKSEKKIREIIAKYVIGYTDKRKGINYVGVIDLLNSKIAKIYQNFSKTKSVSRDKLKEVTKKLEIKRRYEDLKDDFMAIASFRSFKHYCLYFEDVYAPKDKVIWKYVAESGIADGMWHCYGAMALGGDFRKMFKQTPTGYFKTYSNICFIPWLFGINKDTDVLYILGNPAMVKNVFIGVKQQMLRDRYAKIFPYYKQFNGDADEMFEINNLKEGELLIRGANSMCNFKIASKDTPIDGVRFKWRFYDDITRSMDKLKSEKHLRDNALYHDDWTKRRYTEFDDYEIFSGTAYSPYDLICTQKDNNGVDKSTRCQFKYCTVNKDTRTMFVKIPKLDYDTDESTLPEKYTTESAKRERERDAETFFAMEQQEPLPPSGLPFDWKRLRTYTELPLTAEEGGARSNVCRAALDPARTGKDYLSMGIHSRCNDVEYLTSCFYKQVPLDAKMEDGRTALEHCCDLIINKNVIELVVETNTVSNIKSQIEEILHRQGYRACKIIPIYSTQNKAHKIFDNQSSILENIVFPDKRLYAASSMMGQYMKNITTWRADSKDHDDSIDTEAIYSDNFIRKKYQNGVQAIPFSR